MYWIYDLEYDLMDYCIKKKGKWWANHYFRNKEVNKLYIKIRRMSLSEVRAILELKDNK